MKKLLNKIIVFWFIILTAPVLWAGNESSGGGDWFVHPLPILKFQLPAVDGIREGIHFKRIGIRKCTSHENTAAEKDPENFNTVYLPDQNWGVYRVLVFRGENIQCSLGLVESNPEKSLKILVDNENTNKVILAEDGSKQILYSKAMGPRASLQQPLGTYLINGHLFGMDLQHNSCGPTLGRLNQFKINPSNEGTDFVYIAVGIEPSDRIYFMQTVIARSQQAWRLVLPVAYPSQKIPFAQFSKEIAANDCPVFGSSYLDSRSTSITNKMYVWGLFAYTMTSLKIRYKVARAYGVSFLGMMARPDWLEPKFKVSLVPSIVGSEPNHATYHDIDNLINIQIPVGSPLWRTSADVVHELTHVLQKKLGRGNSETDRFLNEMEAHLNERKHILEIPKFFHGTKKAYEYMVQIFNFTVAAALPRVEWSDGVLNPPANSLCKEVITAYKLDENRISRAALKKYNCD